MKNYTKKEIQNFADELTECFMKYFSKSQNLNPCFFKDTMNKELYQFLLKILE